jgi:hypothetical protein
VLATFLIRKSECNKLFRRPTSRSEDNIKVNIMELSSKGVHWIYLAEERDRWQTFVNMAVEVAVLSEIS